MKFVAVSILFTVGSVIADGLSQKSGSLEGRQSSLIEILFGTIVCLLEKLVTATVSDVGEIIVRLLRSIFTLLLNAIGCVDVLGNLNFEDFGACLGRLVQLPVDTLQALVENVLELVRNDTQSIGICVVGTEQV
ncbi:uncharacterized protein LOC116173256 [Photinus pyralis]|uniref:uncharacterized protein LOC116173256 n=1 Tax=Photinus pyralis TaxID=7054 RepID=UPI001267028B|nr:uncharacterized protein LOC116173256 [Photinus pyralis]